MILRGWPSFRRGLAGWVALVVAATGLAHDPGLSVAQLTVRAGRMDLAVSFAPTDIRSLLPATARSSAAWGDAEFKSLQPQLESMGAALWEIQADGVILVPRSVKVEHEAGDNVGFSLSFDRPASGPVKARALQLGNLPPGHREYFSALDEQGARLVEKLLDAKDAVVVFTLPVASAGEVEPSGTPSFWGFLKLGIEHIWTGYDHLLFLFGLLVVCRTFKSIVAIITCFTLAHSITLALATLDIVNLPSRFVEPAIAASIVFVGVENLVRRGDEPKGRGALTFFFGLIHGFGFASVLRELGVGADSSGIAVPLFTFNLGVELGQIAVAGIVLPIVWQLRKQEAFMRRGVPALSALVAAAGLYWLLERTLFS